MLCMFILFCVAAHKKDIAFQRCFLFAVWLLTKKTLPFSDVFFEGARWDSNPRHSEPQSDALTN